MKFFQGDLTRGSISSLQFLLFLLDAKGGKECNRFIALSFQNLKNLYQQELPCEFNKSTSEAEHLVFGEPESLSKSLMHPSITPLGEDLS